MSDVRALLKAKRQEARIDHPYATYTSSGQLKCSVCSAFVKHASAWEGHLGSKLHRTNITRLREEQRQQEAAKAEGPLIAPSKRKITSEQGDETNTKKRRVDDSNRTFPQDFFSDPSRAPVLLSTESDNEDEEFDILNPPKQDAPTVPAPSNVDEEYQRFQQEFLQTNIDPAETYERATVVAEPTLATADTTGFPQTLTDTTPAEPMQLSEEEMRLKKEQEERELIMDRLLAEERAQEDADMRVQLLKARLDAVRRKRDSSKAKK
ncbi:hypothetical protein D9613_007690 [Agrocybe pediades]|uniref:Coiled-coil domain-containing protein 16 n=1 Tax=Agrocybe pediades TaxID=84607 RepID=A0A8H4VLB5_9AGAR|nr:hypothetical protein D9613_007690 [Agrocybe pediades]KAF9554017.1 hypothetical protein CPC08DRAFT_713264 [Agrocybe pediades]